MYLNKEWYGLHASDLASVYRVSGHNVKRSCATLYDFLHANAILKNEQKSVSLLPADFFFSFHVCSSHNSCDRSLEYKWMESFVQWFIHPLLFI